MKDNNEHINTGNASLDELLKRATSEATAENTTDTAIEDENSATATKKNTICRRTDTQRT